MPAKAADHLSPARSVLALLGWMALTFTVAAVGGLFILQLLLNALWSPLFFGLQSPSLALVNILLLCLAILGTMVAFWKARPIAGAMLVPYLAWVSFATALNFAIWNLNC